MDHGADVSCLLYASSLVSAGLVAEGWVEGGCVVLVWLGELG